MSQILAPVVVALLVGAATPWWWDKLFPPDSSSVTQSEVVNNQPPTSHPIEEDNMPSTSASEASKNEPAQVHSTSSKPAPREKFFASNRPVQIAILQSGDKSHKDLALAFERWLSNDGYEVNTALFLPSFLGKFKSRLSNKEVGVFTESGADQLTNCICLFDQVTKLEENELAGEKMITAIFSGKLTLFNLKSKTQNHFEFDTRGAGITIDRAMESVEEKLMVEFADLGLNFSACR